MTNKHIINALAVAMSVSPAAAAIKGFNYGSTFNDQSVKVQSDFEAEFKTAKGLVGAEDFTSARLYTMIQGGTTNTPISAIPAAIAQNTTLLLGLWASGDTFDNEVAALKSAISTYGDDFANLVVGISVGSEDLYRNSPTGIAAKAGIGKNPDDIVNDIKTVRSTIAGTKLDGVPIGHVDTWTAWANSSNNAVIEAVDWLGLDAYPYFQNTQTNDVKSGKGLFQDAIKRVNAASGNKALWVTETGWPVSGPKENLAVASTDDAKTYWDDVGCGLLFDKVNTWWYILQDAGKSTPSPSFGIVGSELTTTPLYDLSCPAPSETRLLLLALLLLLVQFRTSGSAASTSSPSSVFPSSATGPATGTASGTATGSATGTFISSASGTATGTATATGTSTPGAGVSPSNSTATGTPGSATTPGAGSTGKGGASGTSTSTSPPLFTNGVSSVSASMTGIVAAIFAAVVAF
ncbi:GPI-anchored cell wall beta-1,3-endoglucanase EglC [Talaromyces stipitatus ATCC 10500]|uniref:Probable glucan endo-1,3-beta-glucosidase eglC n=1 Tax=Talaromyces stipitatus (strain ATCC 10500 / CBS 375.48 / QM 6759 / NRRL 1006) TaxID=441959 RepID=B8MGA7_TALSN|nr:GPI-anchored cell wall beta-1,3-endoglucanase EglC [Talaromyces stipitatus ATCC 10500]EED16227.1 GPI-anchored cell wall beta-1,3-endoglucanase EglC [Talaromyces stipitatus ATCC 10500]